MDHDLARASDPATPAAELRSLVARHQPALMLAVASNPSAPLDLLAHLSQWAPDEVAQNPVLRLHALTDGLNMLQAFTDLALEGLLERPSGAWLLPLVLGHPGQKSRVIQRTIAVDGDELSRMAADRDEATRVAAARHPGLPQGALEKLSRQRSQRVLLALARRPDVTPEILLRAARWGDSRVRAEVAAHASAPPELLRWLALRGTVHTNQLAMANPALPDDTLAELARDRRPQRRAAAAAHPRLPESELLALAADPRPVVRAAACGNPQAPVSLLERLSRDPSPEVRRAIAASQATPLPLLRALLEDLDHDVKAAAASNPRTPQDALHRLIDQGKLLKPLARNPALTAQMAERLVRGYPDSWFELCSNPATPPAVLESLIDRVHHSVRHLLASNPSTPPRALERLASEEMQQGAGVVTHPKAPRDLLERLGPWHRRPLVAHLARKRLRSSHGAPGEPAQGER